MVNKAVVTPLLKNRLRNMATPGKMNIIPVVHLILLIFLERPGYFCPQKSHSIIEGALNASLLRWVNSLPQFRQLTYFENGVIRKMEFKLLLKQQSY
jgi:hypothetical protein